MGHPDRRRQREKKRKEKMLTRRNVFDQLDLTPYNAVGKIKLKDSFAIKYK